MKLGMSHYGHKSIPDAKFESGSSSSFGDRRHKISLGRREQVHVPNFGGLPGSEDRGGGDNSIQFINFGRVGDKSFKEWRPNIRGWKGG